MKTPPNPNRSYPRPPQRDKPAYEAAAAKANVSPVRRGVGGAMERLPASNLDKSTEGKSDAPGREPKPAGPYPPALAGMLIIAGPMFALAAVLMLGANTMAYLANYEEKIVFRAVLTQNADEQMALDLIENWNKVPEWRSVRKATVAETFSQIEELRSWVENKENRALITLLPPMIDLKPVDFLGSRLSTEDLAGSIQANRSVEKVYYDARHLNSLQRLARETRAIQFILGAGCVVIALAVALLFGWGHGRVIRNTTSDGARSHSGPSVGNGPKALVCANGFFALLALAAVWAAFRTATTLPVVFITPAQAVFIILFGVGLGLAAWGTRTRLSRARVGTTVQFTAILPLLFALSTVFPAISSGAEIKSVLPKMAPPPTLVAPALPDRPRVGDGDDAPSKVVDGDAEQRAKEIISINKRLAEIDQLVRYHAEWLRRTDRERRLDAQNRLLNASKLEDSRSRLHAAQRAVDARVDDLSKISQALALLDARPAMGDGDASEGAARAQRTLARDLFSREASRATRLLEEFDRPTLEQAKSQIKTIEEEASRFEAFERNARLSPDLVREEIERLKLEREASIAQRALLRAVSAGPDPTPIPTPVAPQMSLPGLDIDRAFHLFVPSGTLIHAVSGGSVISAGEFQGRGSMIAIDHGGGFSSLYSFLTASDLGVELGQRVSAGQTIGASGVLKNFQDRGGMRFEARLNGKMTTPDTIPGVTLARLPALLTGRKK